MTMNADQHLFEIRDLLATALDCEEEYLHYGEMSNYMKSYATDAANRLSSLFDPSGPTDAEVLHCCVAAISEPERIKQGRSQKLLLQLRERSGPILKTLADSTDPQLRIFALETASTSINPFYFNPLYGSTDLERRLLNDPDEDVRIAAISATKQTIEHNTKYICISLQNGCDSLMVELFRQLLTLLHDASARVRMAAAAALRSWASQVDQDALAALLEHENGSEVRQALAKAKL